LAYDGYDKARYPDTRTSAYHLLIVSQCAQSKACVHYDLAGPDVQNFLFRGNMSSSQRFTTFHRWLATCGTSVSFDLCRRQRRVSIEGRSVV